MLKIKFIFFDLSGTLVKMRPATLLVNLSLLKDLTKKYSLGIITGARRTETVNILNKLKIYKRFKIIITADDSRLKKPDPRLFPKFKISAYIGDAKKDVIFARNANITFFRINKKYNINQVIKKLVL